MKPLRSISVIDHATIHIAGVQSQVGPTPPSPPLSPIPLPCPPPPTSSTPTPTVINPFSFIQHSYEIFPISFSGNHSGLFNVRSVCPLKDPAETLQRCSTDSSDSPKEYLTVIQKWEKTNGRMLKNLSIISITHTNATEIKANRSAWLPNHHHSISF